MCSCYYFNLLYWLLLLLLLNCCSGPSTAVSIALLSVLVLLSAYRPSSTVGNTTDYWYNYLIQTHFKYIFCYTIASPIQPVTVFIYCLTLSITTHHHPYKFRQNQASDFTFLIYHCVSENNNFNTLNMFVILIQHFIGFY